MRLFISWSGGLSKKIASLLRTFIPDVLQSVHPFMSQLDIGSGRRWSQDIAEELEAASFGVVCLTAENLHRPWILFEAGALAKSVMHGRVVPLLIDIGDHALEGSPLASFQARSVSDPELRSLIHDINAALDSPIEKTRVDRTFDALLPKLNEHITAIVEEMNPADIVDSRDAKTIISEDVLPILRRLDRQQPKFTAGVGNSDFIEFAKSAAFAKLLEQYSETPEDWEMVRETINRHARGLKDD